MVEYRDLLVGLWRDPTPGFFTARAWEEFGRSTPALQIYLPFDDRRFVDYVDHLSELNPRELQYVGARLFDSLFQGEILRLYVHLREQLQASGANLRVRLRLDPPMVGRLPWECLYDTRHQSFLAASEETTLVRFVTEAKEAAPASVRPPLAVLLAGELPVRAPESPLAREARAFARALRSLESEGLITLRFLGRTIGEQPLTREQLAEMVRRDVDILHLVVESRWNLETALFDLAAAGGKPDPVTAGELAGLLECASPRLIVLSAGEAAGASAPALAASLLAHTPALLSHRGRPPEDVVERFTQSFYRELTSLKPVDTALATARRDAVSAVPESGWIPPALFLGRKDARVFYNEARERVQRVYQLSEGRYRRRLREILNRIWPKPERYTRQMLRWMPRQEPMTAYFHAADFLGQPQELSEMAKRFQRLLLLGEAGSGKTMALFRLFYESAQPVLSYRAKSPLPIYVSLADLPSGVELFDYVAHGLDRDLFLSDLDEGRFLFLMDGVDGLSSSATRRLTQAVDAFMHRFPMNRFVLTSRRPIPVALEVPNWVEILPFAEWEALDFLIAEDVMRAEPARLLYRQLAQALGARVGNPQVLAMARRLWREGARVPSTLTGLFSAFFQVAGRALVPELREGLLPGLALFMTETSRTSLTRRHLERDLRNHSRRSILEELGLPGVSGSGAELLLTELGKTRLLRGPRAFSFPNLAFQEFLAAYALRALPPEEIVSLVPAAEWSPASSPEERPYNLSRGSFHGVLPFLAGIHDASVEMICGILDRDLVLASECFREAGQPTAADRPLQEAVQTALAREDERTQAVGCLSLEARGDRWAVGMLETVAADPRFSGRALAVEALGTLRSHHSVPLLKAAALEQNSVLARAALDALSRIKAS